MHEHEARLERLVAAGIEIDEAYLRHHAVETRTAEVNEALRQQTAVSYALRTMSRSASARSRPRVMR